MRGFLFLAIAVLAAAPAAAQVRPQPGAGDPHIQAVDYVASQVVLIESVPGYQVTIRLSPDERVESVALGDSSAWSVTANRRGDTLFVKSTLAGVSTNMTVITNVRLYNFELAPAGDPGAVAYSVRFQYPPTASGPEDKAPTAQGEGRYRLRGDKPLRPSEISDDGTHTYMRWPRDRSLPAVYAMSDSGQEMLVNGMMREDDLFVIDSVSSKLVFRMDDKVATATRLQEGGR
jgi:type IV secretion system protein VirB9